MKFVVKKLEDAEGYGVFVDFNMPGELPLEDVPKWLADFYSREDAEAYKSRKEKEYRA